MHSQSLSFGVAFLAVAGAIAGSLAGAFAAPAFAEEPFREMGDRHLGVFASSYRDNLGKSYTAAGAALRARGITLPKNSRLVVDTGIKLDIGTKKYAEGHASAGVRWTRLNRACQLATELSLGMNAQAVGSEGYPANFSRVGLGLAPVAVTCHLEGGHMMNLRPVGEFAFSGHGDGRDASDSKGVTAGVRATFAKEKQYILEAEGLRTVAGREMGGTRTSAGAEATFPLIGSLRGGVKAEHLRISDREAGPSEVKANQIQAVGAIAF